MTSKSVARYTETISVRPNWFPGTLTNAVPQSELSQAHNWTRAVLRGGTLGTETLPAKNPPSP